MAKSTQQKPKAKQADKNYIAVTAKIFTVLEYVINRGGSREPIAFAELANDLPYSRTTIHRILYSLEKLGYVEKAEGTAHYRLAAKFFGLTGVAVNFRQLQSVAKPVMQKLMTRHAETVNLGVLDRGQVTFIDVLQSPSSLRIAAYPGERCAVHSTALGKALLAFWPEAEIHEILIDQPLSKKTPQTITRKSHFMENLAMVREQGVALDLEGNLSGVTCIAAPIFNDAQRVIAGFSISGPSARMHAKLSAVKEDVRCAALMVTRMLATLSNMGEVPKIQKRRNNALRTL